MFQIKMRVAGFVVVHVPWFWLPVQLRQLRRPFHDHQWFAVIGGEEGHVVHAAGPVQKIVRGQTLQIGVHPPGCHRPVRSAHPSEIG